MAACCRRPGQRPGAGQVEARALRDRQGQEAHGLGVNDFPREGDRRYTESLRILAQKSINPTQTLIEGAHEVGMKVHVSIRPGAWVYTAPMEDFFSSKFYRDHLEWRCYDRDGEDVARMSLAVPQVRTHTVDVLREAVRLGADGISFWDANSAAPRIDRWSVLSRLGHVQGLAERAQEGAPQPVTARCHRLGRFIVDGEYNPNWGF